MPATKTPETDAVQRLTADKPDTPNMVWEHARKLEAQRDSLMAALKEISRILDHGGQAKDLRDIARSAIAKVPHEARD